jgi:hypothetical protein
MSTIASKTIVEISVDRLFIRKVLLYDVVCC